MFRFFWFFLLVCLLFASAILSPAWFASPVYAQPAPQCGSFAELLARMKQQFGEAEIWSGTIQSGGGQMSITVNPEGSTWTAIIVNPSGLACLVTAGPAWATGGQSAPPTPPGTEG